MNAPAGTLLQRTRELLANRPRGVTIKDIAEGSGLSFTFVHGISCKNEVRSPGVNGVQTLYEYLSGRKLEV